MANICNGQQQIHIIPTWIVRAITKFLKKPIQFLGTSTFFLCWQTVYKGLHDFWPLYEYSLKYKSHFSVLRGEKLNYNSCTSLLLRKSQNLLFLAPEVQWALKVYRVCSIHVFFKCFDPCPYLVCHVTTIENV